ncbi:MAG TPA: virulence protein, partial [Clostridiales bacterium]|nr:virulence protein [Clostridiales bacterium]
MKIHYNVTGKGRKSLVSAISKELNLSANYLGMSSAAYQIGRLRIDRDGTLTGPDYRELITDLRVLYGFMPAS